MTTLEVTPRQWEQFCGRIQKFNRGAMVSIEWVPPNGQAETIAQDVPLIQVTLDRQSDSCNQSLVIEAGLPNQRPLRHVIVEPIHIRAKDEGSHRYHRLEILAENGTTILLVHPGLSPNILEGMDS